jgi:predicted DNA-binding antitoxin AbrB/MazE fold protein
MGAGLRAVKGDLRCNAGLIAIILPMTTFWRQTGKSFCMTAMKILQPIISKYFWLSCSKAIYNFNSNDDGMIKMRTRAIYENGVLKPITDLNLRQGEEVDIEISNSVRSTKGIIKLDPAIAKDIADSDECTFLEE